MRSSAWPFGLVSWFVLGCMGHRAEQTLTYGPFEVEVVIRTSTSGGCGDPMGRPYRRHERNMFRVRHAGKLVAADVDDGLFEYVQSLPDAPAPTVLARGQNLRILVDREGNLEDRVVTGGVSQQCLDGQPGPELVAEGDEAQIHELEGCERLLLGRHVVLDVSTLKTHPIPWYTSLADPNAPGPARALSPDGGSVVFATSYTLSVYDIVRDEGYVLLLPEPLESESEVTPEWIERHALWNEQGRLVLRTPG